MVAGIGGLARLLPPTIHPMVVHFPIALLFTAFLLDVWAYRRQHLVGDVVGVTVLTLGLVSLGVALAAGEVAQHEVLVTATTAPLLAAHKRDAIVTALLVLVATIWRYHGRALWRRQAKLTQVTLAAPYRPMAPATRRAWRGALLAELAGLVMLTVTGTLGGSMVYDHGLGVASSALPPGGRTPTGPSAPGSTAPAARTTTVTPGASPAETLAAVATGRAIWQTTCTACHGSPPPFTHAFVTRVGAAALATFLSQHMPPSHPVTPAQARHVVAYFQSLDP